MLNISRKADIKRLTESNLYIPLANTVMLFVNIEHLCISLDIYIIPMNELIDSFVLSIKQCMAYFEYLSKERGDIYQ